MKIIQLEIGDFINGTRTHFSLNEEFLANLDGKQILCNDDPDKEQIISRFGIESTPRFQIVIAGLEIAKAIDIARVDDPPEIIIGRCQVLLDRMLWCMPKKFTNRESLFFVPPELVVDASRESLEELIDESNLGYFQLRIVGPVYTRFYVPFNTPLKFSKEVREDTKQLWKVIRNNKHTGVRNSCL